jgi:uncharacterized protein
MFVCVARLTLQMPESGSLKTKRQLLRRVTDRVKARFNASVSEVDEQDAWQRGVLGLSVVSNEARHATDQIQTILQFIEDLYICPVTQREIETVGFDELMSDGGDGVQDLTIPRGERSLAEAEGMGAWEQRMAAPTAPTPMRAAAKGPGLKLPKPKPVNIDDARAKARALRNRRDWESK